MTVTLERRVRRLEKQVTILKAKVKANDLWKLELQTWIYKKFKKLIIDQVACSPSSGDSSESGQANSEVSDEEEYKVTPRRRRKRARLHLASSQSIPNRPGPKRRVAVVIRQVEDGQASVDKDVDGSIPAVNVQPSATSTVGDRHSNNASTSQLVTGSTSTTTVGKSGEKQEEPSTSVKVEASSGSEGVESDFGGRGHLGTSDDDPSATNATSRLNSVGNKEPSTTTMTTYVEAAARRRRLPGTDKYLEVRPDLQKYFQFYGDTNNEEEELKVVCLVNGCGSILRIKPTCKWSNPVRHLAGVHKIQEYLEQAPSALRTVGYR